MPRVVLDTNVLVSSLIKRGRSRELLARIVENKLSLVLSEEILSEFIDVMSRDKFRRYATRFEVKRFVDFLLQIAEVVKVKSRLKAVKEDPDDDKILECAFDGKANYIVSGDEHLLKMRGHRRIEIVSVAEMLEKL